MRATRLAAIALPFCLLFAVAAKADPGLANQSVDGISATGAALHVLANPQGLSTNVFFQYGVDPATFAAGTAPVSIGTGVSWIGVTTSIDGLSCETLYWYRAVAYDSAGATTVLQWDPFTTGSCTNVLLIDGFESGTFAAWSNHLG